MDRLELTYPKNQDPVEMVGYRACLMESLRFLREEAHCDDSHPLVMALQQHLQLQQAAVEYEKLLGYLFQDQTEEKNKKQNAGQPGDITFSLGTWTADQLEDNENCQLESDDVGEESLEQMRQALINAAYRGCDLHPYSPNLVPNTSLASSEEIPRSPSR